MLIEIDRGILAGIRGCKDTSPLMGAACTNRCEFFNICKIRRTPLLIQALSIKCVVLKITKDRGIFVSQFMIEQNQPDEYINELFEPDDEFG